MRTFLFWWLVSFLGSCVGGGLAAFWCYDLYARVLVITTICALLITWVKR